MAIDPRPPSATYGCSTTTTATPIDPVKQVRDLLLWCRSNGFRVNEIAAGGISLVVDDMKADGVEIAAEAQPTTPHGLWAKQLGLNVPVVDDQDDEEAGAS